MQVSYTLKEAPEFSDVDEAGEYVSKIKANVPGAIAFTIPGVENIRDAREIIAKIAERTDMDTAVEGRPLIVDTKWKRYLECLSDMQWGPIPGEPIHTADAEFHIDRKLLDANGQELLKMRFNFISSGRGQGLLFGVKPGGRERFGKELKKTGGAIYYDLKSFKRGFVDDEILDPNGIHVDLAPNTVVGFRLTAPTVAHRFVTTEFPRKVVQLGLVSKTSNSQSVLSVG